MTEGQGTDVSDGKPQSAVVVKGGQREEEDQQSRSDENNRVPQEHDFSAELGAEVEEDNYSEQESKQARKLRQRLPPQRLGVSRVNLEDELVVDPALAPNSTGEHEQPRHEQHQKVSRVNLHMRGHDLLLVIARALVEQISYGRYHTLRAKDDADTSEEAVEDGAHGGLRANSRFSATRKIFPSSICPDTHLPRYSGEVP
jgi:hypothetical protein